MNERHSFDRTSCFCISMACERSVTIEATVTRMRLDRLTEGNQQLNCLCSNAIRTMLGRFVTQVKSLHPWTRISFVWGDRWEIQDSTNASTFVGVRSLRAAMTQLSSFSAWRRLACPPGFHTWAAPIELARIQFSTRFLLLKSYAFQVQATTWRKIQNRNVSTKFMHTRIAHLA